MCEKVEICLFIGRKVWNWHIRRNSFFEPFKYFKDCALEAVISGYVVPLFNLQNYWGKKFLFFNAFVNLFFKPYVFWLSGGFENELWLKSRQILLKVSFTKTKG